MNCHRILFTQPRGGSLSPPAGGCQICAIPGGPLLGAATRGFEIKKPEALELMTRRLG